MSIEIKPGLQFIHHAGSTLYTISRVTETGSVSISWPERRPDSKYKVQEGTNDSYMVKEVEHHFKTGTWIVHTPEQTNQP